MRYEHIDDCSQYFCGRSIKDFVAADVFCWDEYEDIDVSEVLMKTGVRGAQSHIYFFTCMTCSYPLSFHDKNFGLWRNIGKENGLSIVQSWEKGVDLKRYFLYYGFCEVPAEQTAALLKAMVNGYIN